MARIDPTTIPDLPIPFMNEDHAREADLVNALEEALAAHGSGPVGTLDVILEKLSVLAVHTRDHFLREESMMRQARFPAYPVHKAEHDRVLAEMDREARRFRERGDAERLARYLFDALPAWFTHHVRTMDVVTARFVAGRESAGPRAG
jgi:hemerythrin